MFVSVIEAFVNCRIQVDCVHVCVHVLAVKYQVYLTGKSVVDPPYFFANQFGDGVASVVGKCLHKVLHCEEKSWSITSNQW